MKNALPSFKCLIPLILLCCAAHLYGVNHVVQLGQSIQDKVALADTGDVVIIRGGTYPEQDINGSKAIRLVREKDTTVTIGGNITFSGVDGAMVLRDFPVDVNGNGKLTLSNCSQFGLEDLTKFPQGITLSGSTVIIRDCNFTGNLTIEGNSSVQMINSSCANLDVNGSKFHSVASVFAAVTTSGDSNITLVDSNFTTGSFTSGLVFLKDSVASAAVLVRLPGLPRSTFKDNLTSTNSYPYSVHSGEAFSHNGSSKDCVIYQSCRQVMAMNCSRMQIVPGLPIRMFTMYPMLVVRKHTLLRTVFLPIKAKISLQSMRLVKTVITLSITIIFGKMVLQAHMHKLVRSRSILGK